MRTSAVIRSGLRGLEVDSLRNKTLKVCTSCNSNFHYVKCRHYPSFAGSDADRVAAANLVYDQIDQITTEWVLSRFLLGALSDCIVLFGTFSCDSRRFNLTWFAERLLRLLSLKHK